MEILKFIYRISGWSQDFIWLIIIILAFKKKWFWQEHKRYFLIYSISIFILEVIYAVTAITSTNNLYLEYIYISVDFLLLCPFINGYINTKFSKIAIYTACFLFLIFQVLNATIFEGLENYNAFGNYTEGILLIIFTLWAINEFAKLNALKSLINIPDILILISIFLINLTGLISTYLFGFLVQYRNIELQLYSLIFANLLKSCFLLIIVYGIIKLKKIVST